MAHATRGLTSFREFLIAIAYSETVRKTADSLSFVLGTSSTLFNGLLLELNSTSADSIIVDAVTALAEQVGEAENDVARIANPFANWDAQPNPVSHSTRSLSRLTVCRWRIWHTSPSLMLVRLTKISPSNRFSSHNDHSTR
jgi:hypothetical protein